MTDKTSKTSKTAKTAKTAKAYARPLRAASKTSAKSGKKVAKESTERRKVSTAPRFADTARIKLLTKENPKREGSKSAKLFKLYKTGQTVRQVLDAGQTRSNLRYDVAHGYIEVK